MNLRKLHEVYENLCKVSDSSIMSDSYNDGIIKNNLNNMVQ